MRVLYDHQIFQIQKIGGISRYFFELIHDFESKKLVSWDLPIQYSENEYLKVFGPIKEKIQNFPPDPYAQFLGGVEFKGKGRIYSLYRKVFPDLSKSAYQVNKELSINQIAQKKFDVYHPTYYDDYFLELIGNKPFVITVYDMIHELFPEYFLGDYTSALKMKLIKQATKIIAISENTKRDLITIAGIDAEKVEVTYLGSSLNENVPEDGEFISSIPERFLLFVGSRIYYKNFYFFIQATAPILQRDKDLHVVCTGFPFTISEVHFLQALGLQERIIQVFVDDVKLACLYKHATAFVFPSLYEGFGIPVLESFSCGCPVLLSNTSSLPEVGGDAALYFNPKNSGEIQGCVEAVLYDEKLRSSLVGKGYNQSKKFSWAKTALETQNIYESVKV